MMGYFQWRGSRWRIFSALASLLFTASCSLVLGWDPNDNPCNSSGECYAGFSCLVQACVADGSVEQGGTCTKDVQCQEDLLCSSNFSCETPCNSFYKATTQCLSGQYCQPLPSESDGLVQWDGVCTDGENCSPAEDDCKDAGDICVKIGAGTHACLPGCEIIWDGIEYVDNCGGTPQDPSYCQPIGAEEAQRLVCLPSTPAAQSAGGLCDQPSFLDDPCQPGLACVNGLCWQHCNPNPEALSVCSADEICCVLTNGEGDTYGLCARASGGGCDNF